MSADSENEYFSDGISEEIINALTRVEGLQVTSRTSAFAFKGKLQDIREIGNLLGVTTLLEGSVRKAGDKVRITAQLINVSDGYHFWSETYDRRLEDIFEVQDEISQKIRDRLVENFRGSGEKEKLVSAPTKNIEAYNLFLKGLYHANKFNPDGFRKAIEYYHQALEIDPNLANAYYGLAWAHIVLGSFGQMIPIQAYTKAEGYAKKVIELDRENFHGYLAMGMVQMFYYWNWTEAEKYFNKAHELSPNSPEVFIGYSLLYHILGKFNEALEYIMEAYRLDPLSLIVINQIADIYLSMKEFDKALEHFKKVLELDPHFRTAISSLAYLKIMMGEQDEGIQIMENLQRSFKDELKGNSELGLAYARVGKIDKALECLEKIKKREARDKDVSLTMDFAMLYAALGEMDKSFEYLDRAFQEKHGSLIFIKTFPATSSELNKDPRYYEIMKKLKLD
jgi:TolB-like protein/Tfp pilus assembly protein PilF